MNILGISAFYHDSAAALIRDGEIVAAAQEERFTRKKNDHRFPSRALDYVVDAGGLESVNDADYVVFYDKPLLKFERLLGTYVSFAPAGISRSSRGSSARTRATVSITLAPGWRCTLTTTASRP